MELNKVYNMDCLEGMRKLKDNSIDLLVTDPPYGYSFMGKDWDKIVIGVPYWSECVRVLKPGSFAFVMSAPRQDVLSRVIVNLSEAGFVTGFTSIYWCYASGFPKAMNIGKMVDKRYKADYDYVVDLIIESGKSNREIADACEVSSALVRFWKQKERCIQRREWIKLANFLNVEVGDKFEEAEREVLEKKWRTPSSKPEFSTKFGFGAKTNGHYDITKPATPEAKVLDGSYAGFQPKPAVEVILVAMKPLSEKTYVGQALVNGKGVTWFDDCRVPYESEDDIKISKNNFKPDSDYKADNTNYKLGINKTNTHQNLQGRFPANLLCSDDVLNDGKITKSGQNCVRRKEGMFVEHKLGGVGMKQVNHPDSGSFSRYFSLDAWWQKKIKDLPESVRKTFPFLIVPKASKSEKNRGLEGLPNKKPRAYRTTANGTSDVPSKGMDRFQGLLTKNNHPTVKPLKLMSYLITLGSRKGDLICDPFVGSGTTCISAKILSRNYIGFELNKEYCKIAEKRLANVPEKLRKWFK